MSNSFRIQLLALALALITFNVAHAEGYRNKKTVLTGLLYRAGGPGGTVPMKNSTVEELCEKGYSAIFYTYGIDGFKNEGSHTCSDNRVDYLGSGFRYGEERPVLERVYQAANNGEGPVMVHCWNGYHASGEVAAYALIQFCGWSNDAAADYWGKMMPNSERKKVKGKYKSIVGRVKNYKPIKNMDFTEAQREKFCNPDTRWGDED